MTKSQMTLPQITAALKAGIITQDQARAMQAELSNPQNVTAGPIIVNKESPSSPAIGHEDDMRFLRSFSDVFITIGLVLLVLGLMGLTRIMGGGLIYLGAAALMWMGAEFFGRNKRAHLPTLICALAYLLFIHSGLNALLGGGGSLAALITMGAMAAFYWRIRLPFCIALIAASALFLLFSLLAQYVPDLTKSYLGLILAGAGGAIFAAALAYDMNDKHRTTRFADNAFWLHFLAAPLIIHGLAITGVVLKSEKTFGINIPSLGAGDAVIMLAIILGLTFIGLAINRRALIVSAMGYTAFSIGSLFVSAGVGFGTSFILTLLLLGGLIVFLGVGWHGARNIILGVLPNWRIFPPPFEQNFK